MLESATISLYGEAMKVLCATILVILPTVCLAQCKTATAAPVKVNIGAVEQNKGLLLKLQLFPNGSNAVHRCGDTGNQNHRLLTIGPAS
jgi:hypothetical protein